MAVLDISQIQLDSGQFLLAAVAPLSDEDAKVGIHPHVQYVLDYKSKMMIAIASNHDLCLWQTLVSSYRCVVMAKDQPNDDAEEITEDTVNDFDCEVCEDVFYVFKRIHEILED